MLHLVTDSACDLPDEIIKRYDINIVPLMIDIDGEVYREREEITSDEFYKKMSVSKKLPKTSQPTPASFMEMFKNLSETGPVLCITISSGLSGTYQSACLGRDLSGADISVFDSLGGSLGQGLQIIRAAELADSGYSREEIIKDLEKYRGEMNIIILLNTLDNIVKGGRLSRLEGTLGKLLDVRVLLHNDHEGKVVLQEKVRGKKTFMKKALQGIIRRCPDMTSMNVGITHYNNIEDSEYIKRELMEKCHVHSVIISDMGATMSTYAGEGGMIISF